MSHGRHQSEGRKVPKLVEFFGKQIGMASSGRKGDSSSRFSWDWCHARDKAVLLYRPRCVQLKGGSLKIVEPGSNISGSKQFPLCGSSLSDLGRGFGLGVFGYFSTLVLLGVLMMTAFFINIPTIIFFAVGICYLYHKNRFWL